SDTPAPLAAPARGGDNPGADRPSISRRHLMARTRLLTVAVVAALAAPGARAQQPPPDLALVPADAAGFVHVRIGDAVRSDQLQEFRDLVRKAGPQALEAF